MSTTPTTSTPPAIATDVSLTRLHLTRADYLLTGLGLALVKWPLLPQARTLPLYEGVTVCLLTSLLAFLGLRHPGRMLPLLMFESAWKLLWLSLVALPKAAAGNLDTATADVAFNCSLVVLLLRLTLDSSQSLSDY
jgi:hypothetical protein